MKPYSAKVHKWKVWAKMTQAFKSMKLYNRKNLKEKLREEARNGNTD